MSALVQLSVNFGARVCVCWLHLFSQVYGGSYVMARKKGQATLRAKPQAANSLLGQSGEAGHVELRVDSHQEERAVGSECDDVRSRVAAFAFDLDREVLDIAALAVVAAQRLSAADGVDSSLGVDRHVAAGGADVAAIEHVAGLDVVDEEVVLGL